MSKFVSIDLYHRYKDQVLALTNALQTYNPKAPQRGLSDSEIAEELGISVADVTEIRCIAELDSVPLKCYLEADEIKESRFKNIRKK